jgi:hypothetical protein
MTTSFFNGESTFPENNTTDQLVDALQQQLTASTADSQAAQAAAASAAASANNAAIAEENVAGLSQAATDTLNQANDALDAANAAIAATAASATAAASSATAAAASATTSGTAAGQASVSETNAAASAASALASKNAAATSETNSAVSATAANTSKVNAGTSETNAAASATAANTSKNAAATSASNAATSETNALSSKNAAATSAANAATSESNALTSQNAAAASALVAQNFTASLAGKNRIINGCFRVAQRSGAIIGAVAAYAGPDRWFANASNVGAFSQSASTMGTSDGTKPAGIQTVTTSAVAGGFGSTNLWNGFDQRIEGFNANDLLGKQATLSFWFFSNNVSGLFNVCLVDGGDANSFVTQFSATAGVAKKVTITIPALPTGLQVPISSAKGLTLRIGAINYGTYQSTSGNLNAWQSGHLITGPSAGTAHWPGTIGNLIAVAEVQLEAGSVATPFERRQYGLELALCQRYYQQSTQVTTSWGGDQAMFSGNVSSGGSYMASVRFPAQMRASPAVTMLVPSTSPVSFPTTAPTVAASNNQGLLVAATANATAVGSYVAGWTASAEL